MSIGTVITNKCTEADHLPQDVHLPEGVPQAEVHARGAEEIIAPVGQVWDSFFLSGPPVSDDFLDESASQRQPEREPL